MLKSNVGWPTDLECHGKEIRTSSFRYVGSAETKSLATIFAKAPSMYQLCQRAAKGENVTIDEFKEIIKSIETKI